MAGYIKEENKKNLKERLGRIEGQVRGIKRMVEREDYCIDILTQVSSLVAASDKVATILLKDHLDHRMREAIEKGEDPTEKAEEVKAAIERFLRV